MKSGFFKWWFTLGYVAFAIFCNAQDAGTEKAKLGDESIYKGVDFYKVNNIDSASFYFEKAAEYYKSASEWVKYVSALNDLSVIYYGDKRFDKYTEFIFKAYEEANRYIEPDNDVSIRAFEQLFSHYYSKGDFNRSIEILKEALELNLKNNNPKSILAKSYLNLGNSYRFFGDYEHADVYLRKALSIQLDTIPNDPVIAITYQSIGRVFEAKEQVDSTLFYYDKAKQLLQKVDINNPLINKKIDNFLQLAELWNRKGDITKAENFIGNALQLAPNNFYKIKLQEIRGKVFVSQKKYPEAVKAFTNAQNIAEESGRRNTPPFKARRSIWLAEAYDLLADYESVLLSYQSALKALAPEFEDRTISSNPRGNQLLDKPDALTILNGKAETLHKLYSTSKETTYLTAAYDTYLTATDLIRDIRQGILTVASKNALSEKTVLIYEGAIQTALELYRQTEETRYKTTAFRLAESNKALLLLESINEQSAKGFAGIPDSLLEKEKDIKLNLAFLQKTLLESKANNASVKNIEDRIFDLNQQLDRLTTDFEKNYPRYFELKYRNEPIDLETIQQELAYSGNALLEYFVGEEAIYLFVVTSKSLEVKVIEEPSGVFTAIDQLRQILNHPPGEDARSGFIQFSASAHTLYTLLLEPAMQSISGDITGLTIIPDYQLNYIPFELLLVKTADPDRPGYALSDLDYLVEEYPVSYHYSATLLHKSRQRQKPTYAYDFIGFAPSFKESNSVTSRACTADQLYSLQCSGEEVSTISDLLKGNTRIGDHALKSRFEEEAAACRIIHLATHACIDENDADFNKIFLTDDFLSGFDLYNMELGAELAVLSACNTGSGELVKGEGVMSLARGFINAGCSSTLMSMWSVDDCATSDIMIRFYEGLKKKLNKDEALRTAKLDYLESVSKTKMHPYYWAAFVQFGDVEAMDFGTSLNWLYSTIGAMLLIVILIYFQRRSFQ